MWCTFNIPTSSSQPHLLHLDGYARKAISLMDPTGIRTRTRDLGIPEGTYLSTGHAGQEHVRDVMSAPAFSFLLPQLT